MQIDKRKKKIETCCHLFSSVDFCNGHNIYVLNKNSNAFIFFFFSNDVRPMLYFYLKSTSFFNVWFD